MNSDSSNNTFSPMPRKNSLEYYQPDRIPVTPMFQIDSKPRFE